MQNIKDVTESLAQLDNNQLDQQEGVDVAPGTEARPTMAEPLEDIMTRRLMSRRSFLKANAGVAAAAPLFTIVPSLLYSSDAKATSGDGLRFTPIKGSSADKVIVPPDYKAEVLVRWGDAILPDYADLDTTDLEVLKTEAGAQAQAGQFGFNCDYNGFFPWKDAYSTNSSRGLLGVNHEYTSDEIMFPGWAQPDLETFINEHPAAVQTMKNAHGISIVEVRWDSGTGRWYYEKSSPYNRRLTGDSPMEITGPAAGHELLQTSTDETGTQVHGTLNNCAGGKTPWGTYLTCEENFDQYFGNYEGLLLQIQDDDDCSPTLRKAEDYHGRIPLPGALSRRGWELVDKRFDVGHEPNEAFRFGWVVEIDPYDPHFVPKKRTALGRFKHEGATSAVTKDNRIAIYSGDDARFEYLYKFVSDGTYDPDNRDANLHLLDSGVLHVAKFKEDGSGEWIPLLYGECGLDETNGFTNQGDVLINSRRAGDIVGATPLDRPEDVEPSPETGKVYVVLTNNTQREGNGTTDAQGRLVSMSPDAVNPRAPNETGHILEITEAGDDAAAGSFHWEIFILCGNPEDPEGSFLTTLDGAPVDPRSTYFAGYPYADRISPIGAPDNVAFDRRGNLWIATDGQTGDLNLDEPINDGVYAVPTGGRDRGYLRQFLSGPVGCEICGPEFTPNSTTFFCNIQHPGEGGTVEDPISNWPDGGTSQPRPSVVAVTKSSGPRRIGS
jgi:secreted PhoX family phosphatase